MDAKQEILKLRDGESWIWPESDYGKAEIKLNSDIYSLFEIPMYGGEPSLVDNYTIATLDHLIKLVESWA